MNPKLMVKKGGKCPPGNINDWFFEANGLKEHVLKKLPKQIASKLNVDQTSFGRYPENLLISRRRYNKAYAVSSDWLSRLRRPCSQEDSSTECAASRCSNMLCTHMTH